MSEIGMAIADMTESDRSESPLQILLKQLEATNAEFLAVRDQLESSLDRLVGPVPADPTTAGPEDPQGNPLMVQLDHALAENSQLVMSMRILAERLQALI